MIQASVPMEMWEIVKGVMLALTTAGVGFTAKTVFFLRDEVRDLKTTVIGSDGTDGLNSKVKHNTARLDAIEDRNLAIDTIAELERKLYDGVDRREETRRLRDHLLPEIPKRDKGHE